MIALRRQQARPLLCLPLRGDVAEQYSDAARLRRIEAKSLDFIPAAKRRRLALEARRLPGQGDATIELEPVPLVIGAQRQHRAAHDVGKTGLRLEGGVDLQE